MKTKLLFLLLLLIAFSCQKNNEPTPSGGNPIQIAELNGKVQKGPFLNGTTINVFELNSAFSQTGRSFVSNISDNSGSFQLTSLSLSSQFVEIRANGFYFNEVMDENSNAQLSLSAVSDLTDKTSLNVNLLSTLEKDRVLKLTKAGTAFADAKKQVLQEILAIFEITLPNLDESETLDISEDGDLNAALLAISVILQSNFEKVADLSQLVADINADILNDGTLDDAALGTILLNNAKRLNLTEIRTNLEKRFEDLGLSNAVVPAFEPFVNNFINNSGFTPSSGITYPETGAHGDNILGPLVTEITTGFSRFSFAADLEEGTSLRVVVTSPRTGFDPNQPENGWAANTFNSQTYEREYYTTRTGRCDLNFMVGVSPPDYPELPYIKFDFYENGASEPTMTRFVYFPDYVEMPFYPEHGNYGPNVLGPFPLFIYHGLTNKSASLAARIFGTSKVKVIVQGLGWDMNNLAPNSGWTISPINQFNNSRTFELNQPGNADIKIDFFDPAIQDTTIVVSEWARILLYENDETTPKRIITVKQS
ncbi:MAG: hypothetical protein R2879_17630 [Saprospiraceae bacterium]